MRFAAGDLVHVANLGTGTVREVRQRRRYLVEVKGRAVLLDETQLAAATDRRRRATSEAAASVASVQHASRARAGSEIDLHGLTTAEAVAALDEFVSDAILAGFAHVRVIHGRSGGRLKAAVHQRLRQLPSVRGFRVDSANPGVTIVTL